MNDKISKILKYLYAGTNIVLALYILINTSFLQTTLYQYIAEQNGLTKVEAGIPVNQQIDLTSQQIHGYRFSHDDSEKPADLSEIYYLLAVITFSQIFTPKNSRIKQAFMLVFLHFKKIIDFFRPLLCVSGIAMRAPPISA